MSKLDTSNIEVISSALEYPEGPIYCSDGSIILVEIRGQKLSKVAANGDITTLATLEGGPNGAAVGPDSCIYVCNDGGFDWMEIPGINKDKVILVGGNQPDGDKYTGGSLQKVDVSTGEVPCVECLREADEPTVGVLMTITDVCDMQPSMITISFLTHCQFA